MNNDKLLSHFQNSQRKYLLVSSVITPHANYVERLCDSGNGIVGPVNQYMEHLMERKELLELKEP